MQVVLREDVEHVGLRGDVVNVARGFARNFLLPRGLAELATPGLLRDIERREQIRARHEAQTADEAQAIKGRL
jgi:large subunit ribosomal protein L9